MPLNKFIRDIGYTFRRNLTRDLSGMFSLSRRKININIAPLFAGLDVKRPSHGKLKLANSCWQTHVGVCERRKNSRQTRSICRQQFANVFADGFCAFHTHQLEFANTSLPTLVCRVKAALGRPN